MLVSIMNDGEVRSEDVLEFNYLVEAIYNELRRNDFNCNIDMDMPQIMQSIITVSCSTDLRSYISICVYDSLIFIYKTFCDGGYDAIFDLSDPNSIDGVVNYVRDYVSVHLRTGIV